MIEDYENINKKEKLEYSCEEKMVKRVWAIITQCSENFADRGLNGECYERLEDAQEFCMNRENGRIRKITPTRFEGEQCTYLITDLTVK